MLRPAPKEKDNKAVVYTRVSTDSQARYGYSLEAQLAACKDYCAKKGLEIVHEAVDEGRSAKNTNRPQLQWALSMLARGEATHLVVSKLDRLSRSVKDVCDIFLRAEREGWNISIIEYAWDTSTPMGKAMMGVAAVFAQLERELISERTRAGIHAAKMAGTYQGNMTIMSPPDTINKIESLRLGGHTWRDISIIFNNLGIHCEYGDEWTADKVRRMADTAGLRELMNNIYLDPDYRKKKRRAGSQMRLARMAMGDIDQRDRAGFMITQEGPYLNPDGTRHVGEAPDLICPLDYMMDFHIRYYPNSKSSREYLKTQKNAHPRLWKKLVSTHRAPPFEDMKKEIIKQQERRAAWSQEKIEEELGKVLVEQQDPYVFGLTVADVLAKIAPLCSEDVAIKLDALRDVREKEAEAVMPRLMAIPDDVLPD